MREEADKMTGTVQQLIHDDNDDYGYDTDEKAVLPVCV
jgi:hypothetical protein